MKRLIKIATELGLNNNVHFLGYRNDIPMLLAGMDLFVMLSFREGLSRSLMEAMTAGIVCIASNIRGNVDLLDYGKGGLLVEPKNIDGWARAIQTISEDKEQARQYIEYCNSTLKKYSLEAVITDICDIFAIQYISMIKETR